MSQRTYRAVRAALPATTMAFGVLTFGLSATLAASTVSPLPASDYAVRPACAAPAPGSAGCLALQLLPRTAAARAHTHPLGMTRRAPIQALSPVEGGFGLRPQDLRGAYFPNTQPQAPASEPQTIALVDAYDDPNAEADLNSYDTTFDLPPCNEANGCFKKVNQTGEPGPLPSATSSKEQEEELGWDVEISTDIEAAHSVCQKNCRIVLVEAASPRFSDLEEAESTAARPVTEGGLGATEISDSWGSAEQGITTAEDEADAFNHPKTVITAAAGDDGYLDWGAATSEQGYPDYPASSPHVVAVGGTHLTLKPDDTWEDETVWDGDGATGGGCSTALAAPPWQRSVADWSAVGCGTGAASKRAVVDVSADGDPYTGMAIYDSTAECEYEEGGTIFTGPWCTIGGTSLASPIIAAVFALAGGAHGVDYPAQTLYENEVNSLGSLHDVVAGSNGKCSEPFTSHGLSGCTEAEEATSSKCSGKLICLAHAGYDGPSGIGTPDGIAAFQPGGGEEGQKQIEQKPVEEQSQNTGAGGGAAASGPEASGSLGELGVNASANGLGQLVPVLSGLSLTRGAAIALSHGRPQATLLAFAFTLSAPARVKVALAKQVKTRGHTRWQTLPYALTLTVGKGRHGAHLSAHATLAPGRYRLTLTPTHGVARRLTFQVG